MTDLIFDKYRILRRLAVGGMGEIYLAQQTGVDGFRRYAILKRLLPQLARDERLVEQFLDEARLAATLNHPNVTSIYEVGRSSGTYYIAMEYVHGVDLYQVFEWLFDRDERMAPRVIARIIHDVASGLYHAHTATDSLGRQQQLVHRDVSPSNIMVRKDGVTKLVDFGIAKARHREARTETGAIKGKISYFSPEQANGRPLDARSDQFSLGVVLWELCTNQRLFAGLTPADTLRAIAAGSTPLPSAAAAGVPEELDDIVSRMLQQDPADRFADCREVASALSEFLLSLSSPTDTREVEVFIQHLAGDELDRRLAEEQVTKPDDFVVDFGGTPAPETAPLGKPGPVLKEAGTVALEEATEVTPPRRGRWRWVALGGLLLSGCALFLFSLWDARVNSVASPEPLPVTEQATPTVAPEPPPPPPPPTPEPKRVQPKRKRVKRPKPPPAKAVATPPATSGFLSLNTEPWTEVLVDDRSYGATPLYRLKLSVGVHRLRLRNPDEGINLTKRLRIQPGAALKLKCRVRGNRLTGDCARTKEMW